MALDGVGLRPRVDCTLNTGHGGVPSLVDISRLKLNLDYLPALSLGFRNALEKKKAFFDER